MAVSIDHSMVKQRPEGDRKSATTTASGASYMALGFLIDHIKASERIIGYRFKSEPKIHDILGAEGIGGHYTTIANPSGGFNERQRERIESYAQALTFWRRLILEIDWRENELMIAFRKPAERKETEEDEQRPLKERLRDLTREKSFKVAREMGKVFVDNGFKVRAPVPASMVMESLQVKGHALMIRYPFSRDTDEAGVNAAYDKLVPRLADVVAKAHGMISDAIREDGTTTLFITGNKKFRGSLFDTKQEFKFITRRGRFASGENFFSMFRSLRACRKLRAKYKHNFIFFKPMPAIGLQGHTLAMVYYKSATGKVVQGGYINSITSMTEKLMDKFNLQASVQHRPETRSILVTFYSGVDLNRAFEENLFSR